MKGETRSHVTGERKPKGSVQGFLYQESYDLERVALKKKQKGKKKDHVSMSSN